MPLRVYSSTFAGNAGSTFFSASSKSLACSSFRVLWLLSAELVAGVIVCFLLHVRNAWLLHVASVLCHCGRIRVAGVVTFVPDERRVGSVSVSIQWNGRLFRYARPCRGCCRKQCCRSPKFASRQPTPPPSLSCAMLLEMIESGAHTSNPLTVHHLPPCASSCPDKPFVKMFPVMRAPLAFGGAATKMPVPLPQLFMRFLEITHSFPASKIPTPSQRFPMTLPLVGSIPCRAVASIAVVGGCAVGTVLEIKLPSIVQSLPPKAAMPVLPIFITEQFLTRQLSPRQAMASVQSVRREACNRPYRMLDR
jgi:hypothetical protein